MTFTFAATLDELGDTPLAVEFDDFDVALVRVGDEIFAIRDECSHGNVALSQGDVHRDACAIECYLHGSRFDLRTGAALNLPATQPVPIYPCAIKDGTILVDIDNPINTQEN